MFNGRCQIDATPITFGHDGHQPGTHSLGPSLGLDVVARDWRARHQAPKARPAGQLGSGSRDLQIRRYTDSHRKPVAPPLDHRLDVRLLVLLRRQHECRCQRHVHIGERRVRTLHRPRPQPRDHRQLPALVLLQIGPLPHHLRCVLDRRVQVSDPFLRLVAHPPAVVADIVGQPLRAPPGAGDDRPLVPRLRVHRRPAGESRGDLDHRLVDQHRHRIEIAGVRLKAQPLCFERQRAPAGERIVKRGQLVSIEQLRRSRVVGVLSAGPPPALPDLRARLLEHLFVGRALPENQLLQNPEQTLTFELCGRVGKRVLVAPCRPALPERPLRRPFLRRIRQQHVDVRRRIVDHLREDHRARRRQRPPRPPQMQRRRMAVADRLLPRRRRVDGIQR